MASKWTHLDLHIQSRLLLAVCAADAAGLLDLQGRGRDVLGVRQPLPEGRRRIRRAQQPVGLH